jgi:hypothetical protein
MGGSRKIPMNSLWGYTDPNRGNPKSTQLALVLTAKIFDEDRYLHTCALR